MLSVIVQHRCPPYLSCLLHVQNEFGTSIDLFASEVVAGVGRVNYNQNNLQVLLVQWPGQLVVASCPSHSINPTYNSISHKNQRHALGLRTLLSQVCMQPVTYGMPCS